jgi:hypothetical protein
MSKSFLCVLAEGKDKSGMDQFAYVVIQSSDWWKFKNNSKKTGFDPEQIGRVVYWSKGVLNPDEKVFIEEKYLAGLDAEFVNAN